MGSLTTHVLDVAQGKPGAGVTIALFRMNGDARERLHEVVTGENGRTDQPLLRDADFRAGTYELVFAIGAYFSGQDVLGGDPPFLDAVTVRFTVSDPAAHYHVPLLATPWSYTTYRGS